MKGFALRLVLKQRHNGTRKLPIHVSRPWSETAVNYHTNVFNHPKVTVILK